MHCDPLFRSLNLRRIKLRIGELGPRTRYAHRIRAQREAEPTMHVRQHLESWTAAAATATAADASWRSSSTIATSAERCVGRRGFRGRGELGEAVGDALELQERWEHDVHVWLATARFVQAFDGGDCQNANGDFLGNDGVAGLV